MAKLYVNDVGKTFDKNIVALNHFTFASNENEFVVIVGPSGCGKSTLLSIISGLEKPTRGSVYIDDIDITALEPRNRNIAMVFQDYALYPYMSVYDNIGFYLKLHKYNKNEIKSKVYEIATTLGIQDLLHRKPNTLSGGQKQRVAIARALVRTPQVFLLDEPLSNLDVALREQMRAELIELHRRTRAVFVYVTHDQTEAMSLGDRIVVMNSEGIQQIGTPAEIYRTPKNAFVAQFIGIPKMNFIGLEVFTILCGRINTVICGNYKIGIRPEDIVITKNKKPNCKLIIKELLGKEYLFHVKCGQESITISCPASQGEEFSDGDFLSCSASLERFHFFDGNTLIRVAI